MEKHNGLRTQTAVVVPEMLGYWIKKSQSLLSSLSPPPLSLSLSLCGLGLARGGGWLQMTGAYIDVFTTNVIRKPYSLIEIIPKYPCLIARPKIIYMIQILI